MTRNYYSETVTLLSEKKIEVYGVMLTYGSLKRSDDGNKSM